MKEKEKLQMKIILIADDSRFMRDFLKSKLQGYRKLRIVEAVDGQEAIDIYKLVNPDMVFLDINMPKVDGLTALKEIMSYDAKAKVVVCSAMGTKDNVLEALKLQAIDFVIKPHFDNLGTILTKLDM